MVIDVVAVAVPTRDVILDAAERRFAQRGYAGASVRDIAADVGLRNQASLYHYFPNKQALYEAVLQRGVAMLIGVMAESERDEQDRSDRLTTYVDRVFSYLVEHPHLAQLLQRAALDDEPSREIVQAFVRPVFDKGVRLLRDVSDWPDPELPHLAAGLYHLIFGYFIDIALLRGVMDVDPETPQAIEQQRVFLHEAVQRLISAKQGAPA